MDANVGMVGLALASAFGVWLIWTLAVLQRDLSRLKKQVCELEVSASTHTKLKDPFKPIPSSNVDHPRTEIQAIDTHRQEQSKTSSTDVIAKPEAMSHTDPLPELDSMLDIELPIDEDKLGEIDFSSVLQSVENNPTLIRDLNPKKPK